MHGRDRKGRGVFSRQPPISSHFSLFVPFVANRHLECGGDSLCAVKNVVDFESWMGHFFPMAIAFKEWALVCEALGAGHQSVILRKGGIAEGKKGFGFEHAEFYLFPTWFHGQLEKVRVPNAVLPEQDPGNVTISLVACPEWSGRINDREAVRRLEEFHVLDASVIEERFEYDTEKGSLGGNGINVAFVRVYRLEPAVTLPMEAGFRGCRSWIEFPEITGALVSVLSDEEHGRRKELFGRLLGIEF